MLNLQPSRSIAAEVARLVVLLRVARRQDLPNPPIVAHAFFAPSVLSALQFYSVIVLTQWLLSVALGTRLHGCPWFPSRVDIILPLRAAPVKESLNRDVWEFGVTAQS